MYFRTQVHPRQLLTAGVQENATRKYNTRQTDFVKLVENARKAWEAYDRPVSKPGRKSSKEDDVHMGRFVADLLLILEKGDLSGNVVDVDAEGKPKKSTKSPIPGELKNVRLF